MTNTFDLVHRGNVGKEFQVGVVTLKSHLRNRNYGRLFIDTRKLTRTRSYPDLTRYISSSVKYKPQWPYRHYRDWDLYDDYWYDRYYYFSPLYKTTVPRRYYHSDYIPNPYYWSAPYNYWTRYKGYWYDYDYPYSYRRYYDDGYPRYTYGHNYRYSGVNPYTYSSSQYWNTRFKEWREQYVWDKDKLYMPNYFHRRARHYFTQWLL